MPGGWLFGLVLATFVMVLLMFLGLTLNVIDGHSSAMKDTNWPCAACLKGA